MAGTFVKNLGGLNLKTEDKNSGKNDQEEKTAGNKVEVNSQENDPGLLVNENIQLDYPR